MENFLEKRKFPLLQKTSLIAENFLDQGGLTFLTAEKIIDLKILETNACVETIKTFSEARKET